MDMNGQKDAEGRRKVRHGREKRGKESESRRRKSREEDERNLESRRRECKSEEGGTERKALFLSKPHALTSCPCCQSEQLKCIRQKNPPPRSEDGKRVLEGFERPLYVSHVRQRPLIRNLSPSVSLCLTHSCGHRARPPSSH